MLNLNLKLGHTHKHGCLNFDIIFRFVLFRFDEDILTGVKKAATSFPYVVTAIGIIDDPGEPLSLVMEYMEFGNLKDFNQSTMMKCTCWARKVKMIHEIALGMNYLQSLPQVKMQKCLKLENVLVGSGFVVKVLHVWLYVTLWLPHTLFYCYKSNNLYRCPWFRSSHNTILLLLHVANVPGETSRIVFRQSLWVPRSPIPMNSQVSVLMRVKTTKLKPWVLNIDMKTLVSRLKNHAVHMACMAADPGVDPGTHLGLTKSPSSIPMDF